MASKDDQKSKKNNSASSPKTTKQTKRLEAKAPVEPENRDHGLTIVGIGASKNEALASFFEALPNETGMVFVVVTHLHPEHESHMAELLQKHTQMPTTQVRERVKVEANHVYVIPPNRTILMTDSHLDTREFEEPHGRRTPIDHFFRSMAQSGHSDPIAVVLSGGETDGAVGVKDIKEVGMEEYESSNEEMKAVNEELQSINEEYHSAIEALETSKEELRSVNEELQTVNSEMRNKLDELSRAHQELDNLLGTTEIATLYLDRELRIQRYTGGVQELFNIQPADRGRRISDLTHRLGYDQFVEDAERVLRHLAPVENELQRIDGRWFLMRLRPYRTIEDRIQGVVITFIDVSQLKEAEQELVQAKESLEERVQERTSELDEANRKLRNARDLFYALFNANPIPTVLTRLEDGIFLNVNAEFLNYFGFQQEDLIGHSPEEFNLGLGLGLTAYDSFVTQIKGDGRVRSYETKIRLPSGEWRNILASVQYVELEGEEAMISAFIDITDRVRAEREIRSLASELTATEQTERHRLSQVLHDDLQQRIFAIQMQLSFLKEAYEKGDPRAFTVDFPKLEEWLAEAIRVTRQLSVDLSPPILHGEGLVEAALWLASQMEEQYRLKVDIQSSGTPRQLEEKLRVLVFYALRELLFNIVKHAGTLEATVRFEHSDSRLLVTVSDRGAGFDSAAVLGDPRITHGLMIVRHRLNLLGCKMEIYSEPGKGTEVVIEVPYEQTDDQV